MEWMELQHMDWMKPLNMDWMKPLNMEWIDWRELEASIPLENLPEFHRAFLRSRGVQDPEQMMLRRVQQSVERELNTLRQAGFVKLEKERLLVAKSVLDAFINKA